MAVRRKGPLKSRTSNPDLRLQGSVTLYSGQSRSEQRLTGTGNLRLLRIALLVWPLITGVPAYMVAFVLSAVLARVPLRRPAIPGR